MDDVIRNLGNFCKVPLWHTVMNAKEVEQLFEQSGGWVLCNGRIRNIKADKVTDNCFKVYTEAKRYE